MKLNVVPALQGALWVRNGFRVFFRRPLAFSMLFFIYFFAAQLLVLLSSLGALLVSATLPLASLAFMLATRRTQDDIPVTPAVFVEPLREPGERRRGQLWLGLSYAAALALILLLSDTIGRSAFDALAEALNAPEVTPESLRPALSDPSLRWAVFAFMALVGLLSIPFWHAPALVHWGRQPWARSLFFSTVAWWRNRGALAVYALTWLVVVLGFNLAAGLLFSVFGLQTLAVALATPAGLMFAMVFYASLYFTYADCFIDSADGTPGRMELS